MNQSPLHPSTYLQIAARSGIFIGTAAAVASLCTLYSMGTPWLLFFAIIGFVGVPYILWRTLYSVMNITEGEAPFAILWRTGTLCMTAGALILAIITFVDFRWIDSDYINRMLEEATKILSAKNTPEATQQLADLKKAIAEQGVPGASQVAMQFFVTTVLSGTILAAIIAGILRTRAVKFRNTPPSF